MKKTALILGLLTMLSTSVANAAYNKVPKGAMTYPQRVAMVQMNRLDKDGDLKLSPEEFGGKTEYYGVEEKREIRRAQKKGTYVEPSEQFKLIDTNEDDFISLDELIVYVTQQENANRGKGRYY